MKNGIMLRFITLAILMVCGNGLMSRAASPGWFSIHVVFSAKAYWDGNLKSCVPREKGGCCHIWTDNLPGPGQIIGELMTTDNSVVFVISKSKGLDRETYNEFFSQGQFILDGPITFEPEILNKVSLPRAFSVPSGKYRVTLTGDEIKVYFK